MTRTLFLTTALMLGACSATAEDTTMTQSSTSAACDMRLDFSNESEVSNWRTVLDGVMGGRSSGTRFTEDGHMVFRGTINTNGGGFSSIRRDMQPGDMAGAEMLRLNVMQDERDYKLTFRTDAEWRGRIVNYQVDIPDTPPGEWAEVEISLADMPTYFHGEPVPAADFDAAKVRQIGLIISDGVDGPFRIELKSLACGEA